MGGCMGGGVQWQLGADALYLTRVSGNSYPLLRDMEVGGTVLDTADFAHGWEPGYRVTASRNCTDGWGIEAAFFALADAWRYDTVQTGMLEVQGPGWTGGIVPGLEPVSYHVWNETEFYSGELNLTRTLCDWATCRVGVRYIRLNDTMQVDELYFSQPGLLGSTTTNDLIGPQIGCDLRLCELFCGRLRINGSVTIGALYSQCKGELQSPYFDVPPLTSEANEVALLGEASLTAKLRLTENIAIRGGYHVLGLNGVALAPDQIGAGDIATEICHTQIGSLIAHGASLGLEVFW